jgi:hypothetical protein
MKKQKHHSPEFDGSAFNCPLCGAYSAQTWSQMEEAHTDRIGVTPLGTSGVKSFCGSKCEHCRCMAIWFDEKMIFPNVGPAELPSPDMPEDVRADYDEANSIANASPRGAAALLRLAIQKLCKCLGKPGKNINDDIAALVADGLPPKVQQALDTVRVIGNEAVHPGTIDLRDDPGTVTKLFRLTNFIVQKMISEPKEIEGLYSGLPESKREEIKRRDSRTTHTK